MPMKLTQRFKARQRDLCPLCGVYGDVSTKFCPNCGSRRVETTPWILLGCPLLVLLFVALAAWIGLLVRHIF